LTGHGVDAQYDDPRLVALYDHLNAGDRDFRFYLDQIGEAARAVLDLGCGTGTFALMLAARGHRVTAIDPAPAMLAAARAKPGAEAVGWHAGDLSDLNADIRFDVATLTGHAFQCLLDDASLMPVLHLLRDRLRPGGRLLFETRNPRLAPWRGWTQKASIRRVAYPGGTVVAWNQLLNVRRDTVAFENHYRLEPEDLHLTSRSRLRFLDIDALCQRLDDAGFADLLLFGDWDGAPFDPLCSPEIIVSASV
jgi:SAM-dependent methyltransferase